MSTLPGDTAEGYALRHWEELTPAEVEALFNAIENTGAPAPPKGETDADE